jgi:hypothetical protein
VPRLDRSIEYSGREAALLRKADKARKARVVWRIAAACAGLLLAFSFLGLGVVGLLIGVRAFLMVAALFGMAPLVLLLGFSLSRASAQGAQIAPALDDAWLSAAIDVARQTRGLTAPVLAGKLGIDEAQAEELMALIDVNAAAPRLRIQPSATEAGPPKADLASEEEAALAERIEAKARARLGPDAGKP